MKYFMNVYAKGENSSSSGNSNQGAGRDTNRVPRVQMGGLSSRRRSGVIGQGRPITNRDDMPVERDMSPPRLRTLGNSPSRRAGLTRGNGSRQMTLF